jgi:ribonuclease HII
MATLQIERELWNSGLKLVAGVDEAGRGPLAGPVVAAAVVLPYGVDIAGIDDSKKLSEQKREELYRIISDSAVGIGIGIVDHLVIDEVNILNATFRAMHLAITQLSCVPEHLLIDGPYFAGANIPYSTIVNGDSLSVSIAAASIIAKVTRDRLMCQYHREYPQYGFANHKGYGTREHIEAIKKFGLCSIHRKTFQISSLKNLADE